ncbi:Di-copper centre-containing protein, partial [Basidiobolus meristosporus CBS 931.73]
CTAIGTRKEIRQMKSDEVDAFINAVYKFKSTKLYDNLVVTHSGYYRFGHNSSAFLPWNRYYLRQFEQNLQLFDPTVTLPYWDFTLDSQAPERSTVFKWFGSTGDGYQNFCINDGAFARWQVMNPTRTCLKRSFDGEYKISAFPPPEVTGYILRTAQNFDQLRQFIEYGIHGQVLQAFGGDLSTIFGPNDPLYWLIHSFIDKLWWEWQTNSVDQLYSYGGVNNQGSSVAHCDLIVPWAVPVSAVLDTLSPGLCYVYSPS